MKITITQSGYILGVGNEKEIDKLVKIVGTEYPIDIRIRQNDKAAKKTDGK